MQLLELRDRVEVVSSYPIIMTLTLYIRTSAKCLAQTLQQKLYTYVHVHSVSGEFEVIVHRKSTQT